MPSSRHQEKILVFSGETEAHTYPIDTSVPGATIQVQGDHAIIIGRQKYLKTQLLQSMELFERFGLIMEDYIVSFNDAGQY